MIDASNTELRSIAPTRFKSELWRRFLDFLNEEAEFYGEKEKRYYFLVDTIKNHNTKNYFEILNEFFFENLNEQKYPDLYNNTNFFAGGIHYISRSLGRWFRFNIGAKEFFSISSHATEHLSRIGFETIKEHYDQVPPEYHLCTWENKSVNKNSKIQILLYQDSNKLEDGYIYFSCNTCDEILKIIESIKNFSEFLKGSQPSIDRESLLKIKSLQSKIKNDNLLNLFHVWIESNLITFADGIKFNIEKSEIQKDYNEKSDQYKERLNDLLRLFTLTFLFGLTYGFTRGKSGRENLKIAVVRPYRSLVFCLDDINDNNYFNYGAFAGYFKSTPDSTTLDDIYWGFGEIIHSLIAIEEDAAPDRRYSQDVELEKACRLSSFLNQGKREELNRFQHSLKEKLTAKSWSWLTKFSGFKPGENDSENDKSFKRIKDHTLYSQTMLDLFEEIYEKLNKNDKPGKEPFVVFMYGEPGIGKGTFSKLMHVISHRSAHWILPKVIQENDLSSLKKEVFDSLNDSKIKNLDEEIKKSLKNSIIYKNINNYCSRYPIIAKQELKDKDVEYKTWYKNQFSYAKGKFAIDLLLKLIEEKKILDEELQINIPLFITQALLLDPMSSFFSLNAANLYNEQIHRRLFGFVSKTEKDDIIMHYPGVFQLATMLSGTIFIDEINTLPDKSRAGLFLTALEDPHVVVRENGTWEENVNSLIIFGSNKSPRELQEEGWNPALFSRINWELRIPPYRERPEDIPVFINNFLVNKKPEGAKSYDRISLEALRLLSELKWVNNARELKMFVNELIRDREHRKLTSDEITLEQVFHCLKNLDII